MIGAIAKIQGYPWAEAIVFAVVSFAAISHGLLRFDEWRERRRVEGKLSFTQVIIGRSIKGDGIVVGFRVDSRASFPLAFKAVDLRTRLGNTVPQATIVPQVIQIPAHGYGWYYDYPIAVPNPPKPGTIEGFIEFEIKYGRPDNLHYALDGKKQIIAKFNGDGIYAGGAWHEAG